MILLYLCCFFYYMFVFGELVDKYSAIPNLNLVNEPNLTRILKVEIFVHIDGQIKVAHLILGYNPISSSFLALKYVIKVRDPRPQQINIIMHGFQEAGLVPKGIQQVELPF